MGTTSRLSSDSSAPAADEPVEALAPGELCVGPAETDGEGEPDASDGDGEGDGLFVGLGAPAPPPPPGGAGAGARPPPFPDGSTGEASPSGDVSGALARRSSGSARSRSGVSYENRPLANPAAAITPAAAVPARATTSPVRRRRRGRRCTDSPAADGEAGESRDVEGPDGPEEATEAVGDAYGVVGAGVENSARVEVALGVLGVLVAAVVTGMAIVEARPGPGPPGQVPPGPSSSSPSSTYGRIRRGSKSSAAAASAVRVSRRASDARRPHAQDGEPSEARGVKHSGHM
ncbi:hypothetical protein [Streptomyces sp. NBC_01314]|uniref:hypothetical protein n=1 Tax=Streptomyces sp. NBC_01314 TaxID=2903821 RepID=UPI00308F5EC4|nr:hypothetical protein OG622_35250 [Streptomyces sp. NBC_01314]